MCSVKYLLQITELKAKQFTLENELRNKMKDSDRLNEAKIDLLNKRVAALLKEVAVLSKNTKRSGGGKSSSQSSTPQDKGTDSAAQSSKEESGGSGTDSPNTN